MTNKAWARNNREYLNAYCRQQRATNPEYYNAIAKKYRDNNKDKRKKVCTEWRKANPKKSNAIQKRSYTKRRATAKGNLDHRMSVGVQRALMENKGGRKWESLVGYSLSELKFHIENLFTDGMSWEKLLNGEIHIDHVIPKSVFNFTTPEHEDFKRCWALKNLQPMWAKENMIKSAKLEKHFQPRLALGAAC